MHTTLSFDNVIYWYISLHVLEKGIFSHSLIIFQNVRVQRVPSLQQTDLGSPYYCSPAEHCLISSQTFKSASRKQVQNRFYIFSLFFDTLSIKRSIHFCGEEFMDNRNSPFVFVAHDTTNSILWAPQLTTFVPVLKKPRRVPVWKQPRFLFRGIIHISDLGAVLCHYWPKYWGPVALLVAKIYVIWKLIILARTKVFAAPVLVLLEAHLYLQRFTLRLLVQKILHFGFVGV